ncbi:hypothetical protein EVJ58_g9184 [Rhodofomes roseus]|uniref:Integrase core domain-containing protein n=1 Tax=Rhodofomes roseus TaxID=34475 RepID=A0A4Y9XWT7_9APHY|nr:hypothetical protein EVJ58_g9184 [Rhodofomes roseus]
MLCALDDPIIQYLNTTHIDNPLHAIRYRYHALCEHAIWMLSASMADHSEVLPDQREAALRLYADAEESQAIMPPDELASLRTSLTSLVENIDRAAEVSARTTTLVHNIRSAYYVLCDRVTTAVHTQLGDAARLAQQREEVLRLMAEAEPHVALFSPAEFTHLRSGVSNMVETLDKAIHRSSDPPSGPPLVVAQRVRTGRRGRPRVEIDPMFLETGLQMRGPVGLAPIFSCSSRTVRRRALEHNLVAPGEPVMQEVTDVAGNVLRTYTSTTPPVSALTDDELDAVVGSILAVFPNFGRRMLAGCLRSQGHRVPRTRLTTSYVRVHGVTSNVFADRRIQRRVYKVAGPNALWHHDGQHVLNPMSIVNLGLIRWKLVTHCFIDGWSRYIVAICVHNNNRADTVLLLFHRGRTSCGDPSRVRGDHGGENVQVARWQDENQGAGRGSYIWGRSVHNTRVERLWYDFTRGVGQKWKNFFLELEHNAGLQPSRSAHIWLLHHIFLRQINHDVEEWAASWNNHPLHERHVSDRARSPRDRFIFGMVENGARGIGAARDVRVQQHGPFEDTAVDDPQSYGIDWETLDDPMLMAHHLDNNPDEWESTNPFSAGSNRPNELSVTFSLYCLEHIYTMMNFYFLELKFELAGALTDGRLICSRLPLGHISGQSTPPPPIHHPHFGLSAMNYNGHDSDDDGSPLLRQLDGDVGDLNMNEAQDQEPEFSYTHAQETLEQLLELSGRRFVPPADYHESHIVDSPSCMYPFHLNYELQLINPQIYVIHGAALDAIPASNPRLDTLELDSDTTLDTTDNQSSALLPHSSNPMSLASSRPSTTLNEQQDEAQVIIIFTGFHDNLNLVGPGANSILEILPVASPFTLARLLTAILVSASRTGRLLQRLAEGRAESTFIGTSRHPLDLHEHAQEEYLSYQRGFLEHGTLATVLDASHGPILVDSCGYGVDFPSSMQIIEHAYMMNSGLRMQENIRVFALYVYADLMTGLSPPVAPNPPVPATPASAMPVATTPVGPSHPNAPSQSDAQLLAIYIEQYFPAEVDVIASIQSCQEQLQDEDSQRAAARNRRLRLNLWLFRFRSLKVILTHFGILMSSPQHTLETRDPVAPPAHVVQSRVHGRTRRVTYKDIYDWAGVEVTGAPQ